MLTMFADRRGVTLASALVLVAGSVSAASLTLDDSQVFPDSREYILTAPGSNYSHDQDEGYLLEAVDRAKENIERLLENPGANPNKLAGAVSTLASAQGRLGLYDAAAQNYLRAIELYTGSGDHLTPALLEPLRGLARTYRDAGRLDLSAEAYERALHIDQVNHGLYRLDQSEHLIEMSELHFRRGDHDAALTLQERNVAVAQHNFPDNPAATLPALYARADMLSRMGDYVTSQKKYRRIIGLIEGQYGSDSLVLLPALHRLADVYLYNKIEDGYDGVRQAKRFLQRAIHISENNPDATATQRADAYIAMGDYLVLKTRDYSGAARTYQSAWDLLSTDETLRTMRDERFARAVALNDVPSNTASAITDMRNSAENSRHPNGFVVVRYDINDNGRVVNARVVESRPGGMYDGAVLNHIQGIAFRPRLIDRKPAAAPDNRFEIRFAYGEDGGLASGRGNAPVSARLQNGPSARADH